MSNKKYKEHKRHNRFNEDYRHPKTTQERRESLDEDYYKEYKVKVRPKRNHRNLPDAYDDINVREKKTWKSKRKKKYTEQGRGKRHEHTFKSSSEFSFYSIMNSGRMRLLNYLKDHDISHFEEKICETYTRLYTVTKQVKVRTERCYSLVYKDGEFHKHLDGHVDIYDTVPTGEYEERKYTRVIGYRIVWWSNNDIGVDKIVNGIREA